MKKQYIIGVFLVATFILGGAYAFDRKEKSGASAERLLREATQQEVTGLSAEYIPTVSPDPLLESENASDKATVTIAASSALPPAKTTVQSTAVSKKTALLANGCFWCAESDLAKVLGVSDVVSGYAGGTTANPTYENATRGGHREVVLVTYDPQVVSFANLVEHIVKHGDPTDATGSFNDRGVQYAPAIYYETEGEKSDARKVIDAIDATKVFDKPLPLVIIPRVKFWPAEEYHQDYAKKNPVRYGYYRGGSGRNAFIEKYWKGKENEFTVSLNHKSTDTMDTKTAAASGKWESYIKPDEAALRTMLTPIQYDVTQGDGTERAFGNAYDTNKEEGIYVDILSGEPLYFSKDKYDSGTGWPSFVKSISNNAVILKEDKQLFSTRVEVRSVYGDNHLGHVFEDGPVDRGGKRYCMNSAALRFVPKVEMEKEGYGEYLTQLK